MPTTDWKYKLKLFFLFMAAYAFFYIWPNFWPLFLPRYLPLLSIDTYFSLVPWTFVIYLSDYLLVFTAIVLLDGKDFHSFKRMIFSALFLCGMFFLFYPTAYPRPPYPAVEPGLVALAMWLVGNGDMPLNCFPSMHVAVTGIATWSLRKKGAGILALYLVWSAAIFLSTLTTKQHYFVDIIGGITVVALTAVIDHLWCQRSPEPAPF